MAATTGDIDGGALTEETSRILRGHGHIKLADKHALLSALAAHVAQKGVGLVDGVPSQVLSLLKLDSSGFGSEASCHVLSAGAAAAALVAIAATAT